MSSSSSGNPESEPMHNPDPDPIYDVFLSSKSGDSTNVNYLFTSDLCTNLKTTEISVFWDNDDDSCSGDDDQISPSLLKVIRNSKIFVVVLSISYASSRRCLDLLEQIIECRRIAGKHVLPVFLNIRWDDVCYQEHWFGDAFGYLTERISDRDKVESWKLAFSRICQIAPRSESYDQARTVRSVAFDAKSLLGETELFLAEHLVRFEAIPGGNVRWLLLTLGIQPEPKKVVLIGIWGMVGIGKTILAKAIYNQRDYYYYDNEQFNGQSCFLPNIRKVWEQDLGHVHLQERILSDVCKSLTREKIKSVEIGKKMLKEKLSHKTVLLVLDDVNKLEQLDALCGSSDWFGPGSMIIITTRDRSLLRMHGVEHVLSMKELDENESVRLFNRYLPAVYDPDQLISRYIVSNAGRIPLVLEVLGSKVFGSSDRMSDKFMESLDDVLLMLIKSFLNDLHDIEKDIFLDIACFLIGMKREIVIKTLNSFGEFAEKGICTLEDKGLISFDDMGVLKMNVFLQNMGRKFIREQVQVEPGSWIYDVSLSFSGEDFDATSFTSNLYTYLANGNIKFFKDDEKIRRGDKISISQLQAIQRSKVCVVVLSRQYANSRWCLHELECIMECHHSTGQVIVPLFYCVDSSDLRNQTGIFKESFQNLLRNCDKETSWKTALREISNFPEIVISDSR